MYFKYFTSLILKFDRPTPELGITLVILYTYPRRLRFQSDICMISCSFNEVCLYLCCNPMQNYIQNFFIFDKMTVQIPFQNRFVERLVLYKNNRKNVRIKIN